MKIASLICGLILSVSACFADTSVGLIKIAENTEGDKLEILAVYTSDQNDSHIYSATVDPNKAYLYVSFRVNKSTKVKTRWILTSEDGKSSYFEIATDKYSPNDKIEPGIYAMWWNPNELEPGKYHLKVRVRQYPGSKWEEDSCNFIVTEFETIKEGNINIPFRGMSIDDLEKMKRLLQTRTP